RPGFSTRTATGAPGKRRYALERLEEGDDEELDLGAVAPPQDVSAAEAADPFGDCGKEIGGQEPGVRVGVVRLRPAAPDARDHSPNASSSNSRGARRVAYVDVPAVSSSFAASTSAPYAWPASAPPVEARRTPTEASSAMVGPLGSSSTLTGTPTTCTTAAIWSRSARPGAYTTSAPASR